MSSTGLQGAHLSIQQARLWKSAGQSQAYRSACALLLEGALQEELLQHALTCLLARQEILRTTFRHIAGMNQPMQVIVPPASGKIRVIDLQRVHTSEQWAGVERFFRLALEEPYDLASDLPLRVSLLILNEHSHVLLLCLPALCADATTLRLLVQELCQIYTALYRREHLQEAEDQVLQYIDVAEWQNELLQADDADQHRAYWHTFDLSSLSSYHLPLTRLSVRSQPQDGSWIEPSADTALEEGLSEKLGTFLQRHHLSAEAFLLTCWHVLLWRLTTQVAPTGLICDGRAYEDLATALGLYSRVVPFQLHLEQAPSFLSAVQEAERLLQQAREEQDYFAWKDDVPSVNDRDTPAFRWPALFAYEQWPELITAGELRCSLHQAFSLIEPYALMLKVLVQGKRLHLSLCSHSTYLHEEEGQRILGYLCTLLTSALAAPEQPVDRLAMLTKSEQQAIVTLGTGARSAYPSQSPVHALFEEQVRRTPLAPAVVFQEIRLTYEELNARANQLASYLREQGVGPGTRVGLLLERSAQMIVAILGILKAGGAYVPLDPEAAPARLDYQLQEIWRGQQTRLLITHSTLLEHLPPHNGTLLCVDTAVDMLARQAATNLPLVNTTRDLLYVIYTSGSTGTPKGVEICHESLINYTWDMRTRIARKSGQRFATVSTLAADLGNTMIFCSLLSGGCLHIIPYDISVSGEHFARYLTQQGIDILKIVPSHLQALLNSCPEQMKPGLLPRACLISGGEALPGSLLKQIAALNGTCRVLNHYGPTETTIGVLVKDFGLLEATEVRSIPAGIQPLGQPIANTTVLVLDKHQQPVPPGVPGEIYAGGLCVARGYLHQPELTRERFVTLAYPANSPTRFYRTGDLGYYHYSLKQVEFLGRADTQIKLRGHRIELTEIESLLQRHPRVQECTVILDEDANGEPCLIAFLVASSSRPEDEGSLSAFLRDYMPAAMVPSYWITLPALPLTRNGKVDRLQLRLIWQEERASGVRGEQGGSSLTHVEPRDAIEFELLTIWEEIIAKRPISVLDDFFESGGNSLSGVRLISLIKKHLACDLPLAALFSSGTIAELAALIRQQGASASDSPMIGLQTHGSLPPFFCIHPVGGTVFRYRQLARYMAPDQPFYGLQARELTAGGPEITNMDELVEEYIAHMRSVQQQGPYHLGGWSSGGVIAFAMAQRLKQQGQQVALLALLDSAVPTSYFTPPVAEGPNTFDDAALARWLLDSHFIDQPEQDLSQLTAEEQLRLIWEQARRDHVILADIDLEHFCTIARATRRTLYLVHTYVPQKYEGKITLFRCRDSALEPGDKGYPPEPLDALQRAKVSKTGGWDQLATEGVEVTMLPGQHGTLVEEPYVQELAIALKQSLAEAYRKGGIVDGH
jgi:amino acid adenylation domain-containing protein